MRHNSLRSFRAVVVALCLSGCASHRTAPENDPAVVAALRADIRVVGGETTLVTRGKAYELVGRTRSDLLSVQPALEHAVTFLSQMYPRDSVATIVASVRRVQAPDKPFVSAAPVPLDVRGVRVEVVLVDPKVLEQQRKGRDGQARAPDIPMIGENPVTPVVRAWLSSRASHLTDVPAKSNQLHGEADDPRVPAWATEMISVASNEERIDDFTKDLAAHEEALIPLARYFTMERPAPMTMGGGRRGGATGGDGASGGMGGARGGIGGGRSGMGGGRGGMGGGGFPGGRGGSGGLPGGASARNLPLQGLALFSAQSTVLAKYLARTGYEFLGELADAQMTGKSVDDVFTKRGLGSVFQLDADWRNWLAQRADLLNRR